MCRLVAEHKQTLKADISNSYRNKVLLAFLQPNAAESILKFPF